MRRSSIEHAVVAVLLVAGVAWSSACGGAQSTPNADIAFVLTGQPGAQPSELTSEGELPARLYGAVTFYTDSLHPYLEKLGCGVTFVGDDYTLRGLAVAQMVGRPEDIPVTADDIESELKGLDREGVETARLDEVELARFGAILGTRSVKQSAVSGPDYVPVDPSQGSGEVPSSGSELVATIALTMPGEKTPFWEKIIAASSDFPETAETYGGPVFGDAPNVLGALRRAGLEAAVRERQICEGRGLD